MSRRTTGRRAGNRSPRKGPDPQLTALRAATPARLAGGRAGPRPRTTTYLTFLADHARARDAVTATVPAFFVRRLGALEIATRAVTRTEYLHNPGLGRSLASSARARLRRCVQRPAVQLAITDGLSSAAVLANGGPLLRTLTRLLGTRGHRVGTLLFVRNGRVRIQDEIGAVLRPEVFCLLVGERPGLATADSLSAYLVYRPNRRSGEPDRTIVSNIHRAGVPPQRAARQIAALVDEILAHRASGVALAAARDVS